AFDTKEAGSLGYFDTNNLSQLKDKTADPMGRLEKDEKQKQKQVTANARVEGLLNLSSRDYLEDYKTNSDLRRSFRSDRKVRQKRKLDGAKAGLAVPMVDERADDITAAKKTKFTGGERKCRDDEKSRMKAVRSGGIFGGARKGERGKSKVEQGKTKRIRSARTVTLMKKKKNIKETKKQSRKAPNALAALADYGSSDSEG
ncbi:hypothetical protein TrRE_jg8619, partial [Triparma retinervis]